MIWEIDDGAKPIEGLDAEGRPDPAYARALGLIDAPYGRRAAAAAIDLGAYLVLQLPYAIGTLPLLLMLFSGRISLFGFVNHPQFVLAMVMAGISLALTLAFCITQLVLHGRRGLTLGKALAGIRTVNVKTLERPGFWRMTLRAIILCATAVLPVALIVFLLSPLFDGQGRGRGWHDHATGAWLVDVRKGLQPYDAKRMRLARRALAVEAVDGPKEMPSLATPADVASRPSYRPGARASAGVLGAPRPQGLASAADSGAAGRGEAAPAAPPAAPPAPSSEPAPLAQPTPSAPVPVGAPLPADAGAAHPPAPLPAPGPAPAPQRAPERAAPVVPAAAPVSGSAPPTPPANAAAPAGASARPQTGPTPLRFVLQLDSGESIPVTGELAIGRNPAAGAGGAHPVRVDDETRSLSKTHLLVRADATGVLAIDQHSTNGTTLVHDGVARALEPGVPALAEPGDVLRIGERSMVVARV
ncbi:RDD family protein [Microbacterium album]|uniref:FHA domain-containing protein n=1 Tax=Microbacterium album TaxID=2053191 RepID=A0A917IGD9_9MICO|nr:RDD family protein [Microbacterium album]GGH42960.1 hypothetical protein GCM10010921_16520 [Microbacterium album]